MQFTKLRVIVLLVLAVSSASLLTWHFASATPAPSIGSTCEPGACASGSAYTFQVYNDGSSYLAQPSAGGGNKYKETSFQTLIQTDLEGDSACTSNGCSVYLNSGSYALTTTLVLNTQIAIDGAGTGVTWNAYEKSATEIKWTGTSNNIPAIKILGSTSITSETDSYTKLSNFKLYYSGSATGTDGIYMDGENGLVRNIVFSNVAIVKFSGIGLHAKGTVFDINYYKLSVVNSIGTNIKIEKGTPFTGVPSQHSFFGLEDLAITSGTWALDIKDASQVSLYGGAVAGQTGANGIRVAVSTGQYTDFLSDNVDIEGTGGGATGLLYAGGLGGFWVKGSQVLSWTTGFQVGQSNSTGANYWQVDADFGPNTTDVLITAGGGRVGILGPQSMKTITVLTNTHATSDNNYGELKEQFYPNVVPVPVQVSTASWSNGTTVYTNKDFYTETIQIAGPVNTWTQVNTGGFVVCENLAAASSSCAVTLQPAASIVVYWKTSKPDSVVRLWAG